MGMAGVRGMEASPTLQGSVWVELSCLPELGTQKVQHQLRAVHQFDKAQGD